MLNKNFSLKLFKTKLQFVVAILLLLFVGVNEVEAATITTTGSGNWNSTTPNAPWPGGTVPALGDIVFIANTHTVTLTVAVTKSGGTVTVNQGGTLICNTALAIAASAAVEITISGTVDINVANGLNRSGGATNAAVTSTGVLNLSTTTATVGIQAWDFQTGSTVKLSAPGNQALDVDFVGTGIDNLILSNSGVKTLGEATTVSQLLSLEGTATFGNGGFVLTYGAAAVLQYKTTNVRNAGVEWITPFVGTGGVIIANTAGTVTMNGAKVFNASVPLTINSGATLITNNNQLTLGGNFVNSGGTFTGGSSPIIITNTMVAQTIDAFTTTGLVSATKASGTATLQGNVNGAGLTKSGNGTLNLGTGLTHTFTGVVTLTAGVLNGGSSTLNVNATSATAWNGTGTVFTAGTGTVNFGGAAQTLAASATTFNNLTLSGSATKTLNSATTVNGALTVNPSITLSMGTNLLILNGDLINNGTVSGTTGGVTIAGAATQSIGAFTTTGLVSMTKSANTATLTGAVNGAGLTINGTGTGTLNLGTGLTHTFTGDVSLSAGALNGGSSTLNANSTSGTAWNGTGTVFTAGTGTVNFGGVAQTLSTTGTTTFYNLIFSGSGTKTLGSTTIDTGGTLTSNNLALNFNGDFVNNGTFNGGSSAISIIGAATQSIGAFTTTGLVSMTKSANTATLTGAVNGAGLTINGTGTGTLNLGTGLTHTFTGDVTLSAGALNGGTSTLNVNSSTVTAWNGTGSVFTAGTGTVNFGGAAQTLAASATAFNSLALSGSATKTLNSATTVNGALTVNPSITLSMGANLLTLNGDLINNGIVSGTTGGVTIAGTATQNIGAFTTTGLVSMTKTAGVATLTGAVNGAGLTINGNGGTLNLGTGLTHTFTGALTRTIGTLNGGSSTLNIAGTVTNTGGTFTAGTSTVNFNGAAQTIANVDYYNLTLSGSAAKTMGVATTTIGGNLTMSGTATATGVVGLTVTGDVILGSGTTFTSGAFTHNVAGNWTNNGGTFTSTGGTVNFTGNATAINGTAATQTFNNIIVAKIAGQTLSVGGSTTTLNVGGTFTETTGNFTAPATTTITGNITLTAGTFTAGANLSAAGNWTNNGATFTAGAGTVTFTGASSAINGTAATQTFNNIIVAKTAGQTLSVVGSTTTLNVGGTFTETTGNFTAPATTAITGNITLTAGTFTSGANLTFSGATWTNTTGVFAPNAGTVTFGLGGAQAISGSLATTFNNLTISNSGAKTLTTIPTINGILSMEGTATVSAAPTYGAAATLQYNTTTGRTAGPEWITPFVASGGVKIGSTGLITMNAVKVFNATAPLTINSGASLAMSTFLLTLNGNLVNNGGTTSGSGGVTITGTAAQSIGSFTNTGLVSMTKTAGVATLTGAVNGAGLTIAGAGGTLNLGASLTHTFTGVVTLTTGSLNGGSSTLNENATSATAWNGTGSLFTAGTGTVNFGGVAQTLAATATTFNNLSFSGGGVKTLGAITTVNGTLTLTSGLVTLGANNLLLGATSPAVAGTFSATNMIVAEGAGTVQKGFTAAGSYVFPVGDNTGTAEYSPITVNIASGTFSSAYVSVKLSNAKHPNASATSYINRYWTVVQSGISTFSASIEGTYVPADVVGTFANIISARWITPNWVRYAVPVANKIAATSLVTFGDFSGINNLPIITNSVSSLTGFTYLEGLGPSAQQSFTVSGTDLFTNITVTPSDNYEVSTTSGVSFVAANPVNIPVVDGNIATTTIYVRQKAGLPIGAVPAEIVAITSTGAVTKDIACSGTVTDAPLISPTVSTLSGFAYNFGAGPSAAQSFTVNGANLLANIVLTAPSNYEISLAVASGYGASLSLAPSSGTVSTLVYVRLKAGLLISPYVQDITLTTTSGISKTVTCNGVVNAPTVVVSQFTLAGFIYTVGSGPSGEQTFTASGTNLTANIVLTAPTNFQISLTSGSGYANSISLAPTSNTVAATTIYVRMNAGLSVGIVSPIKLTANSTGAISQTIALSGQVANVATTISSNGTLNGFVYMLGNGPSIQQVFSVSATSLTANVTVTPPSANYEISLTSGSGFISSPSTLTIPHSGGIVNAVPVYVRLKGGLPVATYNAQNIVLSSTGATNVNVVCNGVIVTGPTILAGPAGLGSLCPGASVTLTSTSTGITNQTWTGPNGFYSTAQNPVLGVVTAANNGTYTVTGSALSGVNLLTNGDFELGNTGFGSTYLYQQAAPPEKGNYWISRLPTAVYGGFCACPPHSEGLQMIIDGATSLGVVAWSQTVAVTPGQDYQFSYWVQNVFNHANLALLQLYVNGVPIGTATNAPAYGVPWTQYIYNSNSGSSTTVQLTLINKSLQPDGNDFALDDFVFEQVFPVSSSVTLTVNPTLTPSLAVSASNNPVSEGSEVVFTATPTNGGVSPAYQWYVGGVLQPGATNSTYAYAPVDNDNVSCIMTSNYPCASPATATNNVIMDVTPLYNFWRGTIDNNWAVLGNWTAGFIPAPGNDVVFATVANYGSDAVRDLHLDQNRTIGNLINRTARRLVIPAAKGLLVNNVITIVPPATDPLTGQPTVLTDLIYIYSSPTLANGSLSYHNAVGSPVYASVEMYSKASWNLGLAQGSRYQWQYFGIPLRSIVADPFFYGAHVRKWYETGTTISNHWISLTNSSTVLPFYGYELCQQSPKTYVFQGALENGNFSSGQLAITSGALYPGQHVFANPYTAAIDIRLLTFGSQTEATVYMYHTGTYNAWTSGGATAPGTNPGFYIAVPKILAGEATLPRQVPSMGSMLVKAMTVSSNATFDINYNSVVMNNTDPQRVRRKIDSNSTDSISTDRVYTEIELKGEKSADKLWLFTEPTCTRSFDNGWDGFKVTASSMSPQIFAVGKDGEYQVNAVDDINDTDLGFQAGTDVAYTLSFTHQNLRSKYTAVYLMDLVLNVTVDISANGTQYSFEAQSTPTPIKRFKIVTRHEKNDPDPDANPDSKIKIFNSNKTVVIQNHSAAVGELSFYNISGRCEKKAIFAGNTITAIKTNLIPGVYIVKARTNGEDVSERIIIR